MHDNMTIRRWEETNAEVRKEKDLKEEMGATRERIHVTSRIGSQRKAGVLQPLEVTAANTLTSAQRDPLQTSNLRTVR